MFAPDIPVPLEDLMGWLKGGINPTCHWAAAVIEQQQAKIEQQRETLQEISKQYENQDLNHVDFRVWAKRVAEKALI